MGRERVRPESWQRSHTRQAAGAKPRWTAHCTGNHGSICHSLANPYYEQICTRKRYDSGFVRNTNETKPSEFANSSSQPKK